jgi:hypothetical protein
VTLGDIFVAVCPGRGVAALAAARERSYGEERAQVATGHVPVRGPRCDRHACGILGFLGRVERLAICISRGRTQAFVALGRSHGRPMPARQLRAATAPLQKQVAQENREMEWHPKRERRAWASTDRAVIGPGTVGG